MNNVVIKYLDDDGDDDKNIAFSPLIICFLIADKNSENSDLFYRDGNELINQKWHKLHLQQAVV